MSFYFEEGATVVTRRTPVGPVTYLSADERDRLANLYTMDTTYANSASAMLINGVRYAYVAGDVPGLAWVLDLSSQRGSPVHQGVIFPLAEATSVDRDTLDDIIDQEIEGYDDDAFGWWTAERVRRNGILWGEVDGTRILATAYNPDDNTAYISFSTPIIEFDRTLPSVFLRNVKESRVGSLSPRDGEALVKGIEAHPLFKAEQAMQQLGVVQISEGALSLEGVSGTVAYDPLYGIVLACDTLTGPLQELARQRNWAVRCPLLDDALPLTKGTLRTVTMTTDLGTGTVHLRFTEGGFETAVSLVAYRKPGEDMLTVSAQSISAYGARSPEGLLRGLAPEIGGPLGFALGLRSSYLYEEVSEEDEEEAVILRDPAVRALTPISHTDARVAEFMRYHPGLRAVDASLYLGKLCTGEEVLVHRWGSELTRGVALRKRYNGAYVVEGHNLLPRRNLSDSDREVLCNTLSAHMHWVRGDVPYDDLADATVVQHDGLRYVELGSTLLGVTSRVSGTHPGRVDPERPYVRLMGLPSVCIEKLNVLREEAPHPLDDLILAVIERIRKSPFIEVEQAAKRLGATLEAVGPDKFRLSLDDTHVELSLKGPEVVALDVRTQGQVLLLDGIGYDVPALDLYGFIPYTEAELPPSFDFMSARIAIPHIKRNGLVFLSRYPSTYQVSGSREDILEAAQRLPSTIQSLLLAAHLPPAPPPSATPAVSALAETRLPPPQAAPVAEVIVPTSGNPFYQEGCLFGEPLPGYSVSGISGVRARHGISDKASYAGSVSFDGAAWALFSMPGWHTTWAFEAEGDRRFPASPSGRVLATDVTGMESRLLSELVGAPHSPKPARVIHSAKAIEAGGLRWRPTLTEPVTNTQLVDVERPCLEFRELPSAALLSLAAQLVINPDNQALVYAKAWVERHPLHLVEKRIRALGRYPLVDMGNTITVSDSDLRFSCTGIAYDLRIRPVTTVNDLELLASIWEDVPESTIEPVRQHLLSRDHLVGVDVLVHRNPEKDGCFATTLRKGGASVQLPTLFVRNAAREVTPMLAVTPRNILGNASELYTLTEGIPALRKRLEDTGWIMSPADAARDWDKAQFPQVSSVTGTNTSLEIKAQIGEDHYHMLLQRNDAGEVEETLTTSDVGVSRGFIPQLLPNVRAALAACPLAHPTSFQVHLSKKATESMANTSTASVDQTAAAPTPTIPNNPPPTPPDRRPPVGVLEDMFASLVGTHGGLDEFIRKQVAEEEKRRAVAQELEAAPLTEITAKVPSNTLDALHAAYKSPSPIPVQVCLLETDQGSLYHLVVNGELTSIWRNPDGEQSFANDYEGRYPHQEYPHAQIIGLAGPPVLKLKVNFEKNYADVTLSPAVLRIGARQLTRLVGTPFVAAGVDMDAGWKKALVQAALSFGVEKLAPDHPLASELRVSALTDVGDGLMDLIAAPLREVLAKAAQDILSAQQPSPPQTAPAPELPEHTNAAVQTPSAEKAEV